MVYNEHTHTEKETEKTMYMLTGECISETINVYASIEGAVEAASLHCRDFDEVEAMKEVQEDGMHIAFLKENWVFEDKSPIIMIRKIDVKD